MTILELKRKINLLRPEWDNLEVLAPDSNTGNLLALNDKIEIGYRNEADEECDEDEEDAVKVAIL